MGTCRYILEGPATFLHLVCNLKQRHQPRVFKIQFWTFKSPTVFIYIFVSELKVFNVQTTDWLWTGWIQIETLRYFEPKSISLGSQFVSVNGERKRFHIFRFPDVLKVQGLNCNISWNPVLTFMFLFPKSVE